jgi:ectoine hydroxylase-related dioxygenase (phytanoyl-CoA dioxygenase family)
MAKYNFDASDESVDPDRDMQGIMSEIDQLNLHRYIAELDVQGYTVLEPGVAAPMEFVERVRDSLFQVCRDRLVGFDADAGIVRTDRTGIKGAYSNLFYLIFEGKIFEEVVLNRTAMAMVDYLCGRSCQLLSLNAMVKGPGKQVAPIHNDMSRQPAPLPVYSQMANATWCLSDYSKEHGGLAMIPGSHKWCSHPRPEDRDPHSNQQAVPVEAPFGSLVVWHSNTWHGAYKRTTPGLRAALIMYYGRPYLEQAEVYWDKVTDEFIEGTPERMKTLLNLDARWPIYSDVDIDLRRISARAGASGKSQYS